MIFFPGNYVSENGTRKKKERDRGNRKNDSLGRLNDAVIEFFVG